jgi:hypothetical protein
LVLSATVGSKAHQEHFVLAGFVCPVAERADHSLVSGHLRLGRYTSLCRGEGRCVGSKVAVSINAHHRGLTPRVKEVRNPGGMSACKTATSNRRRASRYLP